MRLLVLGLLPLVCAACANDSGPRVMGYQTSGHPLAITRAEAAQQASSASPALHVPARKTMADKVLTAIALERVTGRKPDPARLTSHN